MPTYEFVCMECKKTFTRVMSLAEIEKGNAACPHCQSKKTEQKPAAFFAKTARKS
ncbi:MAG TPA: FmdB family zinc ribbon protein [Candidatus Sulfopaludibacter sp.]|nr:FmdB family zinc ribbon protein [Terriglobia bacterium]HEV2447562.1 FmdB family zinc ribbon protein [Candidatus Sulfopaludibacter sp.]